MEKNLGRSQTLSEPKVSYKKGNGVFYNLKLSKQSVDTLLATFKKRKKRDKLIFQFYYPAQPLHGSPTLGVYPMRSKNQCVNEASDFVAPILDYHNKSAEPLTGRAQFVGDQELDLDDVINLIKESNKPDPNAYEYLFFEAKFHDNNPHMYYEVTVQPSNQVMAKGIQTDPSPPAPAR
jgi:hypothetical protein